MLVIPIYELLILLVGIGLALLSRPASGGFVNWMAGALRRLPFVGGLSIDQIVKLDRWLSHEIGKATSTVTSHAVRWFGNLVRYQDVVGYWSLYWPVALYHTVTHLIHQVIPRQVTARTRPLATRVDAAEAQAKAAAGTAHSTVKAARGSTVTKEVTTVQRVAMPHAAEWDWFHRHFDAIRKAVAATAAAGATVALPHAPAFPVPFGYTIKNLRRRLHKVEALLGVGAFAAVLAPTLGVGLRCVKPGGNLPRLARSVCRAPSWLIRFLIAGVVEAFILADLCDFTTLLMRQAEALRPLLIELVNAEDALIGCGGNTKPLRLKLPPIDIPPVVGISPLAA